MEKWRINKVPKSFLNDANPEIGLQITYECFHCKNIVNSYEAMQVHEKPAESEIICPDCFKEFYPKQFKDYCKRMPESATRMWGDIITIDEVKNVLDMAQCEIRAMYKRVGINGSGVLDMVDKLHDRVILVFNERGQENI